VLSGYGTWRAGVAFLACIRSFLAKLLSTLDFAGQKPCCSPQSRRLPECVWCALEDDIVNAEAFGRSVVSLRPWNPERARSWDQPTIYGAAVFATIYAGYLNITAHYLDRDHYGFHSVRERTLSSVTSGIGGTTTTGQDTTTTTGQKR
jgi:hypothetical protein